MTQAFHVEVEFNKKIEVIQSRNILCACINTSYLTVPASLDSEGRILYVAAGFLMVSQYQPQTHLIAFTW